MVSTPLSFLARSGIHAGAASAVINRLQLVVCSGWMRTSLGSHRPYAFSPCLNNIFCLSPYRSLPLFCGFNQCFLRRRTRVCFFTLSYRVGQTLVQLTIERLPVLSGHGVSFSVSGLLACGGREHILCYLLLFDPAFLSDRFGSPNPFPSILLLPCFWFLKMGCFEHQRGLSEGSPDDVKPAALSQKINILKELVLLNTTASLFLPLKCHTCIPFSEGGRFKSFTHCPYPHPLYRRI